MAALETGLDIAHTTSATALGSVLSAG